jgi:hypothetical protein
MTQLPDTNRAGNSVFDGSPTCLPPMARLIRSMRLVKRIRVGAILIDGLREVHLVQAQPVHEWTIVPFARPPSMRQT